MRVRLADGGAVSAIIVNNRPLREHGSRGEQNATVFLQPDSEYAIRLKNQTGRRAGVRIFVDGSPITDEYVVIEAGDQLTIDRWLFEEKGGARLKFVRAGSDDAAPGVQLPGNASNGLVEVEWYFGPSEMEQIEKEINDLLGRPTWVGAKPLPVPYPVPVPVPYYPPYYPPYWREPQWNPIITCRNDIHFDGPGLVINDGSSFTWHSANYLDFAPSDEPTGIPDGPSVSYGGMGATVEGPHSPSQFDQNLDPGFVPVGGAEAVMKFVLRLSDRNITTAQTRKVKCHSCGKSVRWGDSFCSGCGADLR